MLKKWSGMACMAVMVAGQSTRAITSVSVRKSKALRQDLRQRRAYSVKNHSKKAMVPGAGIEPARLAAGDFESPASTNFTTRAGNS
jgi:hypothetical protein